MRRTGIVVGLLIAWLVLSASITSAREDSPHPGRGSRTGHQQHRGPGRFKLPRGASFYVGAAKADVTPASLQNFYLGGYGIGPVHEAKAVLRHIYFRVIAVRGTNGQQVVIGALDSQGYSVAYQNGPYGFWNIEQDVSRRLGIPVSHLILQATHSHNGPDEIGVWGGVPSDYFKFVKRQIEAAITSAVRHERSARIHVGTANMKGFAGTFGSDTDSTHTGDNKDYPTDQQLRVMQAVDPHSGRVIATLVNYAAHPTVYGPLDKVSPDWVGATATYLEGDEQGIRRGVRYGFRGSIAVVSPGALGHTWPAGPPRATNPNVDPSKAADANYPADRYGNAVARMAIGSIAKGHGFWLQRPRVGGTEQMVAAVNTNPVLLTAINEPANSTPLGGYKIGRANTPPWDYGDMFVAPLTALRIGELPFFSVPGEPYPSVKFALNSAVDAPVSFIFGLGQDQLGYVEEPSDYNGALQCSLSDEWFFTISPVFGADVVRLQRDNAQALGFKVSGSPISSYGPGAAPSTNCTEQQAENPSSVLP